MDRFTRSDWIATAALGVAVAALAFPSGSHGARLVAEAAAAAVIAAVLMLALRPRVAQLWEARRNRLQRATWQTHEALGHPLEQWRIGEWSRWKLPDGEVVDYFDTERAHQQFLRGGSGDKLGDVVIGRGPSRAELPRSLLRMWWLRRRAR